MNLHQRRIEPTLSDRVSQYEQLWHERFDAIDDLLETLDAERLPELDQKEEDR